METYIAICGLFFLCPSLFWAYRKGLKDGLALNRGAPTVEPIQTPMEIIEERREEREAKAQQDMEIQGLLNILNYDGTPQKGGEK